MAQAVGLGIKAKKLISRGEKVYKILSFSCYNLEDDELPHSYFKEFPYCFEFDDTLVVVTNDKEFIENSFVKTKENSCAYEVGDYVPQDEFEKLMKILKVCGEKLHKINQEIKELRKTWNGTEDFEV